MKIQNVILSYTIFFGLLTRNIAAQQTAVVEIGRAMHSTDDVELRSTGRGIARS